MNETITIDGNEYEVLTLDRISEITHARLAGGKVVDAKYLPLEKTVTLSDDDLGKYFRNPFTLMEIGFYGIQPLKLIERKPVEFVADFAFTGAVWYPLHCLDDGLSMQGKPTMKFRCVQITEEE